MWIILRFFSGKVTRMHLVLHILKEALCNQKIFFATKHNQALFVLSSQTLSNMFE